MNLLLALSASFCAGAALFFWMGTIAGVARERRRVVCLIQSAFQQRIRVSATLRWVANAVYSGAWQLMPEDRFFEPDHESPR